MGLFRWRPWAVLVVAVAAAAAVVTMAATGPSRSAAADPAVACGPGTDVQTNRGPVVRDHGQRRQ